MKLPEIAVALGLSALSVLSSCRDNNLSLDDVHGDYFPFRSQITAIRDVPGNSDSILLATDDGEIMFFDTKRISRSTLSSTGCETIYDMTIHDGCLYYAVRDGGIGKVSLRGDGKPERGAEEWFRINEIKGTQYSPYGILLSEDGKTIYGATSNGIYRWETDRTDICGIPLHPSGDDAPRRFYSVTRRGDVTQNHGTNQHRDVIFFGGDEGVLKLTLQNLKVLTERIYDESVTALNGRFQLSGNRLTEIGGGQNKTGSYSVSFNRKPRNFVVNGGYAYAVSQRAVECADISSGRIVAVIELPEKRLSRPGNKSCRAICLIKNSFLYVAPGGNRLYRIPLAPYLKSEEIISVSQGGENEIYALSESNDLYSVQLRKESDGVVRFENPEYVRTVMKGEAISLAGACGDTVFVSSGDSICGLIGKRRIVGISTDRNDKITCNLFVGTSLYQGKHDMVRVYDYSKTIEKPREIKKYESGPWLRGKDGVKDYYPTKLCMAGDRLVIGTLHNGVYYVDKNMSEPACLIDSSPALRVLDISPADSAAFVLTADTLYRFVFAEECCRRSRWNIPEFGNESGKFNRILPVSEDRIYLFSDGYDFGAYEFILDSDGKWRHRGTVGESALLCDALSFGTAGIPVFCGSDGLSTDSSFAAVHRPSLYAVRKIDAETYWYGRAVLFAAVLLFLALIAVSYITYEKWSSRRKIRKYRRKSGELIRDAAGKGDYVVNLTKALIDISPDLDHLEENIAKFGKEGERLKILAEIGGEIREATEKVTAIDGAISCRKKEIEADFQERACRENWTEEERESAKNKMKDDIEKYEGELNGRYGRDEAIKRYNELVDKFFKEYGDDKLSVDESTYLRKESERLGNIFKDWGHVKKSSKAGAPSYYRRCFLFFPSSTDAQTGKWLLCMDSSFNTRRSEWKNKVTVTGTGETVHHRLHTYGDDTEYSLIALICRAGLKNLE